ncbi:MAG: hypothetical protein C4348_01845 [Patescibacteria group bacterium]
MKELIKRLKASWVAFLNPELVQTKDELTGAFNRLFFKYLTKFELARARRGQLFSIVFFDLDNLKEINDKKGHKAGDLYLKEFAQTVLCHIRSTDLFCRWGGDEFILLLSGAGPTEAERVVTRIYQKFPYFSWGISSWQEGMDLEKMIEEADSKMYQRKREKKIKL